MNQFFGPLKIAKLGFRVVIAYLVTETFQSVQTVTERRGIKRTQHFHTGKHETSMKLMGNSGSLCGQLLGCRKQVGKEGGIGDVNFGSTVFI